ncbi:SigE-dependent sporulation protein [Aquibacillus halophilus]|uniref:SigE-dependent sporulation protein n=1 Tax=Aquibacillus halophilus TaxID=930132 RepID=A0A6A8DSB5_9BACI|nr:sporulation YhaL family protein [Aquibacillus halophilus]MRH44122.1 SigE-dependent sporulation protein [Aquibacillus halophilus]
MILGIPWWVYMFILFIFFSGYMSFRALVAEKKLEKQFIEREGKVYMDRIEEKRSNKEIEEEKKEFISG